MASGAEAAAAAARGEGKLPASIAILASAKAILAAPAVLGQEAEQEVVARVGAIRPVISEK
eukprot:7655000-Lingulodinium_polyedra.AAC.1